MLTVCKTDMCVGCKACVNICPKNAIKIIDSLESNNAIIDRKLCIECNACYNVCQQNTNTIFNKTVLWQQGWNNDQSERKKSSSGGLAAELMRTFLKEYGQVCSCTFKDGKFCFDFVESEEDICNFLGSKYVKSDLNDILKKIKEKLSLGVKILFIGLPCQVEAVKMYCGKRFADMLYTVDLICHGTPSPMLLELFLNEFNESLSNVREIRFREKGKFGLFINSKKLLPSRVLDMYTFAFLRGVDYTENCYSCKFAKLERVSDITIGDSWGTELAESEQKKGISLILCQTTKGEELLKRLNVHMESVDIDKAVLYNKQLKKPTQKTKQRAIFFAQIKRGKSFKEAIRWCYPIQYYKQNIKYILIKQNIISDRN